MIDDIKSKFALHKRQKKLKKNGIKALDDEQNEFIDDIINSNLDDIVEGIIGKIEEIDANDTTAKKMTITNIVLLVGCIIYLIIDKFA